MELQADARAGDLGDARHLRGGGGGGESVTRLLGSEGAGLLHPEPGPL